MPIRELYIAGYRSIRQVRLPLGKINVLTGPNGCGKSNLYNAVFLLARAADGRLARAIAEEGGMPSVLWAGVQKRRRRTKGPKRVVLSVTTDLFGYELQCGLPQSSPPMDPLTEGQSLFLLDPEVKSEAIWLAGSSRRAALMNRQGGTVTLRDAEGRMVQYPLSLFMSESVFSQIQESHGFPELSALRGELRRWRFYHHFRTDPESALRRPHIGSMTPVLSHDGSDLAAALQTIFEIGNAGALSEAIDRAFQGARLEIEAQGTRFRLLLHMRGIQRPFEASELSDGTLRYLCLVAALLTPRPPELLAFNEPETSIHPDLLPSLAKLLSDASLNSQLWVTTHSRTLAEHIERFSGQQSIGLELVNGETRVVGAEAIRSQD